MRRQIQQCWNMPVGARNAQDLIVEVLIEMNQDRTVRSAEVVDQSRLATDPYFRSAAEAALRALRHPKCSPLELPPDQYEQWKTIRFNFDPRDML
ncbi:MAG: cell envelope integrity protein TolA [Alphaproteobacteria bacterium]|nr:cell envelope integrity protein TolA [Alphaproteobacteria bacterium]